MNKYRLRMIPEAEVQNTGSMKGFKQQLQELCQKERIPFPEYKIVQTGPSHSPRFYGKGFKFGLFY